MHSAIAHLPANGSQPLLKQQPLVSFLPRLCTKHNNI